MKYQVIFWLLVASAIILAIGIAVLASSIKSLIKSKSFKEKNNMGSTKVKSVLAVIGFTTLSNTVFAGGETIKEVATFGFSDVVAVAVINLILILVFFYFKNIFDTLAEELIPTKERKESSPWFQFNKTMTDAVAIEDEDSILMDHEYDGIRELDNNLPPWWLWGFYATIVFAVLYLGNYHVWKSGDLQLVEYEKNMIYEDALVAENMANMNLTVDESTVTLLTDQSELDKGKAFFTDNCVACHGGEGEGGIGPNFTDNAWMYGNKIDDVFKTIKYGAKNGMRSWNDDFTGVEIQQIASYLLSIQGTNHPNGKEPQGEVYESTWIVE